MRGFESRAREIGAQAVARLRGRVAAALRDRLGDAVREEGDAVQVNGARAVRQMLADPALRWVAGLLK